jgi:SET and MYND domain-containing protein 4
MRKFEKKESKFMKYKELGNNCFSKKDYREAAILYNKALCHATSNLQLSLLYANRSAVYLEVKKFKECLENIQLAKNSGYPQEKMAKLIAREVNCKTKLLIHQNEEKLSKVEEAVKKFFKLSYKSHPTIPHIIDGIELRRSEEFGRHLITTRDLKAGDMIAIEEPFLKYLESGHVARFERCANCLRQNNFNLIPCNKCSECKLY